jgi:hypothetical protein
MYRQPQRVIFTDASQFAGAGFTVGDNTIRQIFDVPGEFQDDGNPILDQIVLHI